MFDWLNGKSGNKSVSALSKEQLGALNNMMSGYGQVLNGSYGQLQNYAADPNASNTFARNGGNAAFDNMVNNIAINKNNSYKNLANSAMGRFSTAMAGQRVNLDENATKALNDLAMNKFATMSDADAKAMAQQLNAINSARDAQLGLLNVKTKENQQTYNPSTFENVMKGATGLAGLYGSFK